MIERALDEDLGSGDVTAEATVPAEARARAHLIQKEPGVIFGLEIAEEVFRRVGVTEFDRTVIEGHWHESVPRDIALIHGPARARASAGTVASAVTSPEPRSSSSARSISSAVPGGRATAGYAVRFRYSRMKPSMSPSSTFWVSPTSNSVR